MEPIESRSFGMGWLAPANIDQPHDLILFDKKRPPRDDKGWPVFGVVYGTDEPVCGAKKRKKEAYCGQPRRKDNGRCKHHGAGSFKGAASPTYKHGKTSKYQPRVAGHLQERFDLLMKDDTLHHHRKSIAALDAMIDEVWTHFKSGWDHDLAQKALSTYRSILAAQAANNRPRAVELFETLGQQLEAMVAIDNQSEKIVRFLSERRRHADSETRRMLSEKLVFSLEEAQMFYGALGAAVNRNITNPEEKRAVLNEIAAVAGARRPTGSNGPTTPSGG
jgi:hypothetical protein